MDYRAEDAREAEAEIRRYWRWRTEAAEARAAELEVLRQQIQELQEHSAALQAERDRVEQALAAQHGRRVVRAADRIKAIGRRNAQPTPEPEPESPLPQPVGPAFSVLMPVFNKGELVTRAVESVYCQTLPDWELLVWDDGSTDPGTLKALEAIDGPNTRLFREPNQGVIAARRHLAQHARGEFWIFLDADDELRPTYLEKALLTFIRFPTVDIVVPSVKVLSDSDDVPGVWMPAHFEERRLAYENTTPIASAFRARLWHTVGGMSPDMATGYEDWEFWRRCAHHGAQGWVLDDALFLYRHSMTTGRDAEQRHRNDVLVRDIKQLTPRIEHPARPIEADPGAVTRELASRVFHIPNDGRRSLVVFAPWMLVGGGADGFLKTVLRALTQEMNVLVITTEQVPAGHLSDLNDFLDITPYVYHLPGLMGRDEFPGMVQSLLYRMTEPAILQMGSPWAYQHMPEIRTWTRGFGPVIDIQFNHVGHIAELLQTADCYHQILVSNAHLRSLLVDYFEVRQPVDVMYVAPGQPPVLPTRTPRTGPLRVGWLGRNSPEKRPDLVADIAAAAPDLEFVMAGGGFDNYLSPVSNLEVAGFVPDSWEFLAGLDLLLNTSDTEGISVAAMEALQLGIPVATRDVGGMTELIRDGYNGLVYDASDVVSLARRLQDSAHMKSIAEVADRERLPKQFHEDSMIAVVREAVTRKVWNG